MIHLSFSICRTEWPVSCLLLKYWPCHTGAASLSSEKHCLCCRKADVLPALWRTDAGEGCLGFFTFNQKHHYVVACSIMEKQNSPPKKPEKNGSFHIEHSTNKHIKIKGMKCFRSQPRVNHQGSPAYRNLWCRKQTDFHSAARKLWDGPRLLTWWNG